MTSPFSYVERDGAQVLVAASEYCHLEISTGGAHVTSFIPAGHEDLLWLSPAATFAPGEHIRGGIPLIGPWFGRGRSSSEDPQHGWFRRARWDVESKQVEADGTLAITLALAENRSTPEFPVAAATLMVRAKQELEVSLTVVAGPSHALELEAAHHTYFRVGDVRRAAVVGLEGVASFDAVAGAEGPAGPAALPFAGETDLVFGAGPALVLADPALGRAISIEQIRASRTVVWNPGEDLAATLDDIPGDEWTRFACVESAVSREGFVRLEPGESSTLGARYGIRHLA